MIADKVDRADVSGDNDQLERVRRESSAAARIVEAERLAEALDVVEAAVPQVHPRTLPVLAERLARAYGRAMRRLRVEQRRGVRAALRRARGGRA